MSLPEFDSEKHMGRLVEFVKWNGINTSYRDIPGGSATFPTHMEKYKEMLEHLKNNRKIQAIKNVREITGKGLKDAKDIVDLYYQSGKIAIKPPLTVGEQGLILECGRDVLQRLDTFLVYWSKSGEQLVMFEDEIKLVEKE